MAADSTLQEEIERFEGQYRSQPESLVFARLADAYRKAGETERALEVLAHGLARHPDYPSGHIVRARTLRDLGRLNEAAESFRRVLELDAENLVAARELDSLADAVGEPAVDAQTEEPAPAPGAVPSAEEPTGGSEWWNDPADAGRSGPADVGAADDDDPLAEEEVVAAILNGEVPRTIKAEDTWWYEERSDEETPEPSAEADLLTRTMADLYAEQGLHAEAAEIYEELLRDSPDDETLRVRLDELRTVVDARKTASWPASEPREASELQAEAPSDGAVPQPHRPRGLPVADELRRLLRRGEESAALLDSFEGGDPLEPPDGAEEDGPPAPSDFARDWLTDLG